MSEIDKHLKAISERVSANYVRATPPNAIDTLDRDQSGNLIASASNSKFPLPRKAITFSGANNTLILGIDVNLGGTHLSFNGDNCRIVIGDACSVRNARIGVRNSNCNVIIGSSLAWRGGVLFCTGPDVDVIVGDLCMFADKVMIRTSDGHGIFDLSTQQRLNRPASVIIHEHVWLGNSARVSKGTVIGEGTVVGQNSIVTGKLHQRSIYAGIPGRRVRSGIAWSRGETFKSVPKRFQRSTLFYIPHGGQSLAAGGGAKNLPPADRIYSKCPPTMRGLMFESGTRGAGDEAVDTNGLRRVEPAFERYASFNGETPGTAMMAWLASQFETEGNSSDCFLYRNHAKGGRQISALSSGSTPFANFEQELRSAIVIAEARNQELFLPAIIWTHGDADRLLTNRNDYSQALRKLRDAYEKVIRQYLSEHSSLAMLIDQLSSSFRHEASDVALAQLDLAESFDRFYISTPKYIFHGNEFGLVDSVHLRPKASALLGEYHARTWHILFSEKGVWTGTRPKSIATRGKVVELELHAQSGPIRFDLETMAEARNYGFRVPGETIKNVSIVGPRHIEIALANGPDRRSVLEYALNGGSPMQGRPRIWGNVCDSDETFSLVRPDYPLANYLVSFAKPLYPFEDSTSALNR